MPFTLRFNTLVRFEDRSQEIVTSRISESSSGNTERLRTKSKIDFAFPNYGDYGYGIFLLDDKSRDYVLKNIQNEKDPFLRSMMWGSLWDSVREAELAPKDYVELVIRVQSSTVQSSNFSLSSSGFQIAYLGAGQGIAIPFLRLTADSPKRLSMASKFCKTFATP